MARTHKRRTNDFLASYELEGAPLLPSDRKTGRPGLQSAMDDRGDPVLIKHWPRRTAIEDADLHEIWAHEIRQLHRLAGYPGASQVIAELVRSGVDSKGYYLVLDPGARRPLQTLLDRAPTSHWLKQPRVARHRARLWRNLKRIAQGLELLHAQGLLHRNLDTWSVLTGSDEDLDFQLTGFEWSIRIVSAAGGKEKRGPKSSDYDSFSRDWSLFGGLAAQLCGAEVSRLIDRSIMPSDVAAHLNPDEIRFLRSLADIDPFSRVDGETIADNIDGILANLASDIASRDPKLYLVVKLGERSRLSDRIRDLSGGTIEGRDVARQIQRIREDLSEGPRLVAIRNQHDPDDFRMALRGRNIIYRLRPYAAPQSREDPKWDFAQCDSTDDKNPTAGQLIGSHRFPPEAIEVLSSAEAGERFGRLRGKLTSWAALRQSFVAEAGETPPEENFRRGLVLTQFLEMLQAACDVFPVDVEPGLAGDDVRLAVRLRPDNGRDELTKIFGWKSQRRRFEDRLFGQNAVSDEDGWQLSDSAQVGEKSPAASEWQFDGFDESGQVYMFRGTSAPGLLEGYLVPGGAVGRDAVFRRRLKALRALREHTELLGMLTHPRARILDSHEAVVEDEAFAELDQPKQAAFKDIVSTLPLYLVQGPPGVGKTRLVRDLVRRRFEDDRTTRLLLTAQSNAAVNHLMDEVTPSLAQAAEEAPLVIRCTSRETKDAPHELEVAPQATRLLKELAASPLAAKAPPRLRHRLEMIAGASAEGAHARQLGWSKETDRRSFEGIVMRAANVVFATTNSAELEKLIEERGQADWAIVEEAAKATGGELVSPSLLSHRRLMIGDHQQLPPFGALQMAKLLEDPDKVRRAIFLGRGLVSRSLRGPDTDEDLDEIDDDDFDFPALCGEASRSLLLFQTLIEAEFQQQRRERPGRPIAKALTEQHRMHPQIAELVAKGFYETLETHTSARRRYETDRPPFTYVGTTGVLETPILVVDMPYLQVGGGGEAFPPFHNPDERQAVLRLLAQVRAREGHAPSLAILSPYRHQVSRLKRQIEDARASRLSHLGEFRSPQKNGDFTGTVDSFQGNEADLVMVSLVRNNQHTNLFTALGFLTDKRRMNVLLSRARWQLVLITSLSFMDAVLAAPRKPRELAVDIDHLHRVRSLLQDGIESGSIGRIDGRSLAGQL